MTETYIVHGTHRILRRGEIICIAVIVTTQAAPGRSMTLLSAS